MAPFSPTFKNINQPYYYIHFIILIAIAETFSLLRQKCVVVFVNLYLTSVCPGLHLYIRGAAWVVGRVLPETQRYYLWLIILMISVSNRSGPHLNHQIIFVSLKFSGDCRVLYLDTYIEFEYLLVVNILYMWAGQTTGHSQMSYQSIWSIKRQDHSSWNTPVFLVPATKRMFHHIADASDVISY